MENSSVEDIKINLPSGKVAVVKSFTTHGDDRQAQAILNSGIVASTDADGSPTVTVSVEASQRAEEKYVELLLKTVDGTAPIINDLRSDDYEAIAEVVREITSPKGVSKS